MRNLVRCTMGGLAALFFTLSLALAYVDQEALDEDLTVFVVGEPRAAEILPEIPYDPTGTKLRA